MRWLVGLVLCAGCNQVFGLHNTGLQDAYIPDVPDVLFIPPDATNSDTDTIPDFMDNCPLVANQDQADFDSDGIGDACDPCPLLPSPHSGGDTDGDGIPDVCDPHPNQPLGDCLVLFDTFADSAAFATNWVVAGKGSAKVSAPGQLDITTGSDVETVYATGFSGTLSVQISLVQKNLGSNSLAYVAAATQAPSSSLGQRCELTSTTIESDFYNGTAAATSDVGQLSGPAPVGDIVLRLATDDAPANLSARFVQYCEMADATRVGAAALTVSFTTQPTTGSTGIEVSQENATVHAVAFYSQLTPGATCPAAIIR